MPEQYKKGFEKDVIEQLRESMYLREIQGDFESSSDTDDEDYIPMYLEPEQVKRDNIFILKFKNYKVFFLFFELEEFPRRAIKDVVCEEHSEIKLPLNILNSDTWLLTKNYVFQQGFNLSPPPTLVIRLTMRRHINPEYIKHLVDVNQHLVESKRVIRRIVLNPQY
ncbi:MAG: hypothetical protein EOO43_20065 [Flavobacterium sp.]|nr:MAG: hypothetical protein EOO43_20065 [Flavobacterium sp.]